MIICLSCCWWLYASGQTPEQRCETYKWASYKMTMKGEPDSALLYAGLMKDEAIRHNLPAIANESEFYFGLAYRQLKAWRQLKECYMTMVRFHRVNNKPEHELMAWQTLNTMIGENDTLHPSKKFIQEQMIRLSMQLHDTVAYARALCDMGISNVLYGRLDEAEAMLLKADGLLKKLRHPDREFVLSSLCNLYVVKTNASKAAYYAQLAEECRIAGGLPANSFNRRFDVWNMLTMYGENSRTDNEYFQILENHHPHTETDAYYITIFGWKIYREQGARKAINYLEPKVMADKKKFSPWMLTTVLALGDFYMALGDTTRAMVYYRMVDELVDVNSHSRDHMPAEMLVKIADVHFQRRNYDSAFIYLQRAGALYTGQVRLVDQIKMHRLFYMVDSVQGRYVPAMSRYARYQLLRDSLFNVQKWAEVEDMQLKYETTQKDQELKQRAIDIVSLRAQSQLRQELLQQATLAAHQQELLLEKDVVNARQEVRLRGDSLRNKEERIQLLSKRSELQQVALEQTLFARNAIVVAAVLLLLLLMLIYNRYLLRQRSSRQLQRQQEEISHKNEALGKLVDEKEWLLKEVHHRVKNNLQVVMSLLNIQSFYLHDDQAISAIRDSQRRVNAISLIHKKLYQSDNPAFVDMPLYIHELMEQLWDYGDTQQRISRKVDIDPVMLEVGKALPVGLIINEAVTNAFKYAFPDNRAGIVHVSLKRAADGALALEITDNGVGWSRESNATPDSLGMSLMNGLAQDMDGELVLQNSGGLSVRVVFAVVYR